MFSESPDRQFRRSSPRRHPWSRPARASGWTDDAAVYGPRCAAGRAAQLLEIVSGRNEFQDVHWISSGGRKASDELR